MNPRPDQADHDPCILIVDDERQNRDLLEVMLALEGYVLQTAAGGEEALAMMARTPPDLVLLDIMMPGMDGYQVVEKIKADVATKNIPVIMVSAQDDRHARMLGLNAGAEDFLTKPVDRAELRVRVRNLLRLKAYGDYHDKYSQMLETEVGSRTVDLVERERLYRSTFDEAPVGIVHAGLDGAWLRVNQRLCQKLGYSLEELQGPGGRGLVQAADVEGEAEALREIAAGTRERHVLEEKQYRRRDGSALWARVFISLHRDADAQARHFILVIEDITERRMLEAQFRQSTKMDAIGQLASGVAHDFNNLLTVILGFGEIMAADPAMSEAHGMDLGEMMKAARRASGLTAQLLAFSREQVLVTAPVDVNDLITDMAGMLGRLIGQHIEIALTLAPDLAHALADRGQLERVVMNLVVNARDAMPDGGLLTITTEEIDLENSSFHEEAILPGRYVMVAVTDTGTGMTVETRRHLFEPFFTTKEPGKGTGLGLSTTYGIVKQSKGLLWVYSELGQGTTFKVYLPRAIVTDAVDAVAPVAVAVPAPERTAMETVLLVDDETSVRRLTKRILDQAGYRVLEAANGDDAEKAFARDGGSIDLVVTDIFMPGCGGPELLERLHRQAPGLRVLYMSGYTEQSAARNTGFDSSFPFVQKPFTSAELVRQVRGALDRL